MSFSVSDKDVCTPEWAQEVMDFLGMNDDTSSQTEERDDLLEAPFRIRIPDVERRDLNTLPRGLQSEREKPPNEEL